MKKPAKSVKKSFSACAHPACIKAREELDALKQKAQELRRWIKGNKKHREEGLQYVGKHGEWW